jgi:hypothetical protein
LDYFGARYYLSAYGRWGSVDALSEKHPGWSPYAYVLANPLKLVDPDGRQVEASWLQKYGTAYLWRQAEAGWDRFVMNPAERVNLVRERAKHQVEGAIQYAIEHREAVDRLTERLDAASVTLTGATLAMAVTGNEPVAAIGAASVRITSAASTGGEFVGFLLAYADRNSTGREITLRAIRIPLTYFGGKIVARVLGPSVLQEIATALPGLSPEFQKKLAADLVGLIDLSEIVDVKESELEENKDQH